MDNSEAFDRIWWAQSVLAAAAAADDPAGSLLPLAGGFAGLSEGVAALFDAGLSAAADGTVEEMYRTAGDAAAAMERYGEEPPPQVVAALTEILAATALHRRYMALLSADDAPETPAPAKSRGRRRETFADFITGRHRAAAARIAENAGRAMAGKRGKEAADVLITLFRMGYISPAISFAAVNNSFRQTDGKTPLIRQRDFRRYVTERITAGGELFSPASEDALRPLLMV